MWVGRPILNQKLFPTFLFPEGGGTARREKACHHQNTCGENNFPVWR